MNATRAKKNVAGYVDEQGRFRPIRSPQYIGSRKATAKDRKKYSPAKAGDLGKSKQERALEAPWDTELRIEREAAERKKRDQDRIMREIEGEAFGTGESRKKGYTLLQFVRSAGGIRRTFRHGGKKGVGLYGKRSSWDSGEIDRLSFKETGKRGLTTDQPNKGRTMDKMFQAARESGYDVTSIDDMMERIESEAAGSSPTYATHGSLSYNPRAKRNGPDWGMRVCANCDKYTANKDLKKLGEINVCKACHKKLTASKAAKSQASLFDDQGSLFNPKAAAKLNPGMAWEKYNHKWFLKYRGETLAIVTQNNPNSYSVEGERGSSRTLTLAKQKALRVGKAALKSVKAKLMTDAEMISVVNRYGSKAIIKKHGKAVGVRAAGGFNTDKWKVRFADGTEIETRIPKRNPAVKKNPDGITMFAQLASGVASALQVREMLNRKPAAKKRKTTRRKNPSTAAKAPALKTQRTLRTQKTRVANPRKQVTVPAKGDYYLLTIGSGDDIMAVYLQDGDKDGFSKRFKTVAAAKSYATKKRLRLKANPIKAVKATAAMARALKANPSNDRPPVVKRTVANPRFKRAVTSRDREQFEARKRVVANRHARGASAESIVRILKGYIEDSHVPSHRAAFRKLVTKYSKKRNPKAAKAPAKRVANPVKVLLHKFYVGQKLTTRFIGDYDAILRGEVISRTPKMVTVKIEGERQPKRCKITVWDKSERIYPLGKYSMAPTFTAKGYGSGKTFINPAAAKAPAKRVAKKNPTKPRSALYEKFQGRKPERLSKTLASEHAPQTLVQLGKLHEVKLMGVREAIKFNPSRVRLCAAHGKLWITGAKIDRPDPKQNPGTVHPIAEIDHVVYETWKPHHGDQPGQRYIHKLGEWSGNRPTLCVDREGYPVIKGGAYTIEDRGIVD